MLYLYGKTATTEDFKTHGIPIHGSYDEHVIRDSGYYLKFKVLLDKDEKYKDIHHEMIIGADTPDGYNQFRVHDIVKTGTYVEVTAVQLHYDLNKRRVHSFSVEKALGSTVIKAFVDNLKSPMRPFTISSGLRTTHNFSTDDDLANPAEGHNALEILNRICTRWGAELMLNGYDIRMVQRLGKASDALLYEHKNISEFADESTVSNLITRIHVTSKYRPERAEDDTEQPEEVVIKTTVDSPLINQYAQIYEADYTNNDLRTEAELIAWAKLKYSTENVDKPTRSIKVDTNIIDGTEIEYGDEVVLKYLIHDVDELIRCVGYDYNPINHTYYSITLGSITKSLGSVIVDHTNSNLDSMYDDLVDRTVQIVRYAANETNRVTTGPLPVPNPVEGDLWFYHPEGYPQQITIRRYLNGEWVDIVDGLTGDRIKQQIAELASEAESLAEEIAASESRASEKADQALQDAKDWAENLEGGLKIHASQITAGEIETARLKTTEIVSQGLSGNEESITQLVIGEDVFKSSVTNLAKQKVEDELENDGAISSQITQLYDMINLSVFGKDGALSRIAMGEEGIQIDGKLLHITAKTYIDDGVIKNAMIDNLNASKITTGTLDAAQLTVINIDFNSLSGNKTAFLESLWQATNSRSYIDGTRIRLESGTQGAYVELNNIPEFRSQFHDGTAVVMAKGRTQFFEPNGGSQGYIGRDIHTGTNDFGIFVSRGKGFRIARATDSSSSVGDKFYTVKSGMNWRVAILEDMVRRGILPDGDSNQFVANSNKIAKLNGWPILPRDWPTLRPGDQVMYEKGKIVNDGGTGVSYEDIMNFGKNGALTEWWLYMRQHVRFEAGYSSSSDRRIKHDIQPTSINAVDTISALSFKEFKMNRDDKYVPLGLIAQESGLLRVEDPVNEALNMELATLLSLKGVQELKDEIEDLKEQIKTLQNR